MISHGRLETLPEEDEQSCMYTPALYGGGVLCGIIISINFITYSGTWYLNDVEVVINYHGKK